MATYDVTNGVGAPWRGMRKVMVVSNRVNHTGIVPVENDDYQVLKVPANHLVLTTWMVIHTGAVGTTCTLDIGYGGNGSGTVDDFDANVDGKVAGVTYSTPSDTAPAAGGVLFTTADTIDVNYDVAGTLTAGPDFTLYAMMVDCSEATT